MQRSNIDINKTFYILGNSYPMPNVVQIAVQRDTNANAWVNTFSREFLVSHPAPTGVYLFRGPNPNDNSDCMALDLNGDYQYFWNDLYCTDLIHAICIEQAIKLAQKKRSSFSKLKYEAIILRLSTSY